MKLLHTEAMFNDQATRSWNLQVNVFSVVSSSLLFLWRFCAEIKKLSNLRARVHVWSSLIKPSWTERLRASSQLHRWSSLSGKVSTWQPAGEAGRVGPQRRTEAGQRRAHQGQNRLFWTRSEPTWAEPRPKVTETETKTKPRGKNKSRKIQQAKRVLMRARKTEMDLQSTVFDSGGDALLLSFQLVVMLLTIRERRLTADPDGALCRLIRT